MEEIKITCLTPLWTGDIDSKSDLLESSGIMGSLRWWTEAILRSLNYFACDPTDGDNRCPEDEYCLSCLIFGATGIRRLFRLEVEGGRPIFSGSPINIKPNGRNRGWYLGSGLVDKINLKIVPLSRNFDINLILVPLKIIANWGGLGAKTQHGYGVIQINTSLETDFNRFLKAIENITKEENLPNQIKLRNKLRNKDNTGLPNLTEMFFAKVLFQVNSLDWWKKINGVSQRGQRDYYEGYANNGRMKNWVKSSSVPIAPAIKNWLRYGEGKELWKPSDKNEDKGIANWLFGTIRNDKSASKINISYAVFCLKKKSNYPEKFNREKFLEGLKEALEGKGSNPMPWNKILGSQACNHKLTAWQEYKSQGETVELNITNIEAFIKSLLIAGGHK